MGKNMNGKAMARGCALVSGAAFCAALLGASGASANIVYTVNQTIGGGSVTGTLTTDGATGVLGASDFLGWNLTLKGLMGAMFNLTQGNSVAFVQGSDVNATLTDITFNFGGGDNGILLFQDGLFSGTHYWCNATQNGDCFQGKTVAPISIFDSSSQNVPASGIQVIASVSAAVPEPSTWALMLLGFASLGYAGYRRARQSSAAPIG
jgi:hypothetical protein